MALLDFLDKIFKTKDPAEVTQGDIVQTVRKYYPQYDQESDQQIVQRVATKVPGLEFLSNYQPDKPIPPTLVPRGLRSEAFYSQNQDIARADAADTIERFKARYPLYKNVDDQRLADAMEKKWPDQFKGLTSRLKEPIQPPSAADLGTKPEKYTTELTPAEEVKFNEWVKKNNVPFDPSPAADYDMRGFFKAMTSGDPRAKSAINPNDQRLHFPDTWKTPFHKTFSNESIYAGPGAPRWEGSKLVDSKGQVLVDEAAPPQEQAQEPQKTQVPLAQRSAAEAVKIVKQLIPDLDTLAGVTPDGVLLANAPQNHPLVKAVRVQADKVRLAAAEVLGVQQDMERSKNLFEKAQIVAPTEGPKQKGVQDWEDQINTLAENDAEKLRLKEIVKSDPVLAEQMLGKKRLDTAIFLASLLPAESMATAGMKMSAEAVPAIAKAIAQYPKLAGLARSAVTAVPTTVLTTGREKPSDTTADIFKKYPAALAQNVIGFMAFTTAAQLGGMVFNKAAYQTIAEGLPGRTITVTKEGVQKIYNTVEGGDKAMTELAKSMPGWNELVRHVIKTGEDAQVFIPGNITEKLVERPWFTKLMKTLVSDWKPFEKVLKVGGGAPEVRGFQPKAATPEPETPVAPRLLEEKPANAPVSAPAEPPPAAKPPTPPSSVPKAFTVEGRKYIERSPGTVWEPGAGSATAVFRPASKKYPKADWYYYGPEKATPVPPGPLRTELEKIRAPELTQKRSAPDILTTEAKKFKTAEEFVSSINDHEGSPDLEDVVQFHGTQQGQRLQEAIDKNAIPLVEGRYGKGFYLTSSQATGEYFGRQVQSPDGNGRVMTKNAPTVFSFDLTGLKIKRITDENAKYDFTQEDLDKLVKEGYDGVNFVNLGETVVVNTEKLKQIDLKKVWQDQAPASKAKAAPAAVKTEIADEPTFKAALGGAFKNLTPAQVESVSSIVKSRAATWSKITGRPESEYYSTRFKEIKAGGTPSAEALAQESAGTEPRAPGFYSGVEKIVSEKMPNAAPADQVRSIISNAKQEEVKWLGVEQFLEGKEKVSKAEMLDFVRANQVKVEEVVKGASPHYSEEMNKFLTTMQNSQIAPMSAPSTPEGWMTLSSRLESRAKSYQRAGSIEDSKRYFDLSEEAGRLAEGLDSNTGSTEGMPKFSKWQLPGGENYREMLLTLPGPPFNAEEAKKGNFPSVFRSSHFDEPNILAHVRFNERTGPKGERILFLEEVQSDWHQAGREKGYSSDLTKAAAEGLGYSVYKSKSNLGSEAYFLEGPSKTLTNVGFDTESAAWEEIISHLKRDSNAVPDAPFKKTWHELALKRMLRYAAENGFDKLAWTTGEQQAERYDLSKQVDAIRYQRTAPDIFQVYILKDGKDITPHTMEVGLGAKDLASYVGKEIAKKIVDGPPEGTITGENLKVGGEGMKGFYDQILPSFLNKYAKKWGGRVGQIEIDAGNTETAILSQDNDGLWIVTIGNETEYFGRNRDSAYRYAKKVNSAKTSVATTVHSLDITHSMKRDVLMVGQPLFQGKKGFVEFGKDLKGTISALQKADVSTAVHELGHIFRLDLYRTAEEALPARRDQIKSDIKVVEQFAGVKDGTWTRAAEEKFARGFESYLATGNAENKALGRVYDAMKEWLQQVYLNAKNSPLNIKISQEVRNFFDRFLSDEPVVAVEREPWQMTKDEFWKSGAGGKSHEGRGEADYKHQVAVAEAVVAGKPVPAQVLREYGYPTGPTGKDSASPPIKTPAPVEKKKRGTKALKAAADDILYEGQPHPSGSLKKYKVSDPVSVAKAGANLKSKNLPILQGALVQNGWIYSTDLDHFYGSKLANPPAPGVYKFVGENLEPFNNMEAQDFPIIPEAMDKIGTADRTDLLNAAVRALPFVSEDPSRLSITGLALMAKNGRVIVAATDGRTLYYHPIRSELPDGTYIIPDPKKFIKLLAGVKGETLEVSKHKGQSLMFSGQDSFVASRLIDAEFPAIHQVIREYKKQFTFDRDALLGAIKELAPYLKESKVSKVVGTFENGVLSLTNELGDAHKTVTLPAKELKNFSPYRPPSGSLVMPITPAQGTTYPENTVIAVDSNYLKNALNTLQPGQVYMGAGDDAQRSPYHFSSTDFSKAAASTAKGKAPSGNAFALPEDTAPSSKPGVPPEPTGGEKPEKENLVWPGAPNDFNPKIETPELVKLTKELLGQPPVVRRILRSLGLFQGYRGMKIGKVNVRADIFKDVVEATKILAHEIGHMIDWLPNADLSRGNILGRLKTLHEFRADVLNKLPTADDANLDRVKIRRQAINEVAKKHGITLKQLKVDKALRLKIKDEVSARYEKLLKAEAEAKGYYLKEIVQKELQDATRYWHPFDPDKVGDRYLRYRYSSRELYAEALSMMLTNPDKLKEIAPTFYKAFWDHIDRKPEVKRALMELDELLGAGQPGVLLARQKDIRDMFNKGETLFRQKRQERAARKRSLWFRLKNELIDKNSALIQKVKAARSRGTLNPEDDPAYFLEAHNYLGGKIHNLMSDIEELSYQPALDAGITEEDLGEYLFLRRVATERSDIANPLGQNRETARAQLRHLLSKMTPEQLVAIKKSTDALNGINKTLIREAKDAGFYKPETYAQIATNNYYATFQVLDYLDEYVTAKVVHQVGTFKEIANPYTSTLLKMISLKRAIERNKARAHVVDFMRNQFPEEITEAEYRWVGKGREVRDKEGYGTVTVYENGTLRGYYLDPYIADSVNYKPGDHNNAVVEILRFLNQGWFRPLYINLNFGFQTFNFLRDFQRFWKLNPETSFLGVLKAYYKAAPHAAARVWGDKLDPVIREMNETGMLGLTYNDIFKVGTEEDSQVEHLMERFQVWKDKNPGKGWQYPFKWALERIEEIGNFVETMPKVARYMVSKGKVPPQALAHEVRVYAGSPDFLRRGSGYSWYNTAFLFSNAIKEGIRGDFEGAFKNPRTRAGYWWKTAAINILPKIAMFLVALGLFGKKLKDIMDRASEYDRTNYTIIPLGMSDNGQAAYLRIPQDEAGRMVGAIFWRMLNRDKGLAGTASDIFSLLAGQTPSMTPSVEMLYVVGQYLAGQNPYDFFRNRNILTEDEQKARGREGALAMGKWFMDKSGLPVAWSYKAHPEDPIAIKIVRWLPILNRFIKYSEAGITQSYFDIKDKVDIQFKRYKERPGDFTQNEVIRLSEMVGQIKNVEKLRRVLRKIEQDREGRLQVTKEMIRRWRLQMQDEMQKVKELDAIK